MGRPLYPSDGLRVDIQSQAAIRVPHEFLSGFNILTTALEKRGKRPTERVPAYLFSDAEPLGNRPHVTLHEGFWPVGFLEKATPNSPIGSYQLREIL